MFVLAESDDRPRSLEGVVDVLVAESVVCDEGCFERGGAGAEITVLERVVVAVGLKVDS